MLYINPLHLNKTRPRVLQLQGKLIRKKTLEDIGNIERIEYVHISWKVNYVSIIVNLLKNAERTNLFILKLIVCANGKMVFWEMDHHQNTFVEQIKEPMLVYNNLVTNISLCLKQINSGIQSIKFLRVLVYYAIGLPTIPLVQKLLIIRKEKSP